jgi:hypothetical protein
MTAKYGMSHDQMESYVKELIGRVEDGDSSFLHDTENFLSGDLEESFQDLAFAQQQGVGLQEAIDKVWLVFYSQFPSGS